MASYFRRGRFLFLRGTRGLQLKPSLQDLHHDQRDISEDRTDRHPRRPQYSHHLQVPEDCEKKTPIEEIFSPVVKWDSLDII